MIHGHPSSADEDNHAFPAVGVIVYARAKPSPTPPEGHSWHEVTYFVNPADAKFEHYRMLGEISEYTDVRLSTVNLSMN
jgi:hypothetical protein